MPTECDRCESGPTRYHRALLSYLQAEEAKLWEWFSSNRVRAEHCQAVRLDLLKTTYRLERDSAAGLYATAERVAERLGHAVPVTIYQAQHANGLNAALAWIPDEVHVVLHGPVQETLSESELHALLAHELAHHLLFSLDNGAYLIVDQILTAMLGDRAATAAHQKTWQFFRLHTELFCDRNALAATTDLEATIRALVKMETGISVVSAEAYLKQAAEILAGGPSKSEGLTHPEMFIRARALQLWHDDPESADAALQRLIEGPMTLGDLDLLRQDHVTKLTRRLLQTFLAPDWMRTDSVLAHAKQFFEDFAAAATSPDIVGCHGVGSFFHAADPQTHTDSTVCLRHEKDSRPLIAVLRAEIAAADDQLRDYFCYVLLDFVTSDPDLEEAPLAAALLLARELEIEPRLIDLAMKELRLRKRQFESVRTNAETIVAQVEKAVKENVG